VVDEVSLSVRAGEIVGIAGVAGNGQLELLEAIAGLRPSRSGEVRWAAPALERLSAGQRRESGWPTSRGPRGHRICGGASVADNLALGFHRHRPLRRGWRLDRSAVRAHAAGSSSTSRSR
jgi:simple sugar transport system ATP-binding protein